MRTCIFPGTFDPFTLGHLDITERATKIFDKVIVAVSQSEGKNCMFALELRKKMAEAACAHMKQVEVYTFNDLLTEFAKRNNADIIVRGLRTVSDLEYESALSEVYRTQYKGLETVFLLNMQKYSHIRGTIVRDLIRHCGDISMFVPKQILEYINSVK